MGLAADVKVCGWVLFLFCCFAEVRLLPAYVNTNALSLSEKRSSAKFILRRWLAFTKH